MFKQFIGLLVILLLCGCQSSIDKFIDRHDSIDEQNANKLDGPYWMKDILSPNTILVKNNKKEIKIILRGCIPVNNLKMDLKAKKRLGPSWDEIYLLKDSTIWLSPKTAKAIVYKPANRIWIGYNARGKNIFKILFYIMPQLVSIAYGELKVDHSDTDYPLYKVFKEAERLAKENKKGYWETH
jgi:hypothetical protein